MSNIYGIGAQFKDAAALLEAAKKVREAGYRRWDTHSPFPVHGIEKELGMKGSLTSGFALLGGVAGLIGIAALILYTSKINYPLVVQGKPYFSLAATFPVMFEVTVIAAAYITVIGVFLLCLLPRLNHPVFNWDKFARASDDGFFVVIQAGDPLFDEKNTARLLAELGGKDVTIIADE